MVKQSAKKYRITNSKSDKIFDAVNIVIMILLLFIFVWPLWFVVISSFSNPYEVWKGNVLIWFKGFTLKGYEQLFNYEPIWIGYRNRLLYTVLGSVINMVMTVLCAYPLSRKDWLPRNFFMKFCLVTMYFGGGLIPTYLVVRNLRMTNTIWAMMIPCAMSFYNALIVRSYFSNSIPHELQEAAELDGASKWQRMWHISLPSILPTISIILIMNTGGILNSNFDQMWLLRNSANLSTAEVIDTYVYQRAIYDLKYSFGTAVGLFKSVINVCLLLITNFVVNKLGQESLF